MISRLTITLAILAGLILGQAVVAFPTVICTPLGVLTPNLQLCKPAAGESKPGAKAESKPAKTPSKK